MRILVICNYFDGGPDSENSCWKVLEDEIVIDVPQPLPGNVYDLYCEESYDTLEEIGVSLDYHLDEDCLNILLRHLPHEKYCDIKLMYDLMIRLETEYEDLNDMYPDLYEMKHANPEYAEQIFEQLDELRDRKNAIKKKMLDKYANENGYVELGWENLHHIGINEFCEINHIDKVISL